MGNNASKNKKNGHHCNQQCITKQKKISNEFFHQLHWSGWIFTVEHQQLLLSVLVSYNLKDMMNLFVMMLGDENDEHERYYRLIRPGLCNIDDTGPLRYNFPICTQWVKSWQYVFCLFVICRRKKTIEDLYLRHTQLNNTTACDIGFLDCEETSEFAEVREKWVLQAHCFFILIEVCTDHGVEEYLIISIKRIGRRLDGVLSSVVVVGVKDTSKCIHSQYKKNFGTVIAICKRFDIPYIEICSVLDPSRNTHTYVDFLFQYAVYNACQLKQEERFKCCFKALFKKGLHTN
ncbi:hypothetical protein RFI_22458 [Reticulomyxa filosa]|uniref:Uncharacterized protein n=1 Tax=Reticulomyxa filosa TaxID=46433 RepID=X6MMQ7_RETFI|nr:hypothetical protein RFI_22458 [Reticulomyxa filosa]|eukprot:ETO14911.1 hypothetical protein RFI_22458 [Reticulomyxa filosa]